MDLNDKIIAVAKPIVGICVADSYEAGSQEIYSTFNFTEMPEGAGDNGACAVRASCQLHLYCPRDFDSRQMRRALRHAIAETEDFTPPTVTNAGDAEGQHYVFEFESLEVW